MPVDSQYENNKKASNDIDFKVVISNESSVCFDEFDCISDLIKNLVEENTDNYNDTSTNNCSPEVNQKKKYASHSFLIDLIKEDEDPPIKVTERLVRNWNNKLAIFKGIMITKIVTRMRSNDQQEIKYMEDRNAMNSLNVNYNYNEIRSGGSCLSVHTFLADNIKGNTFNNIIDKFNVNRKMTSDIKNSCFRMNNLINKENNLKSTIEMNKQKTIEKMQQYGSNQDLIGSINKNGISVKLSKFNINAPEYVSKVKKPKRNYSDTGKLLTFN
jgi:hypothetical protein